VAGKILIVFSLKGSKRTKLNRLHTTGEEPPNSRQGYVDPHLLLLVICR
jgi:hypothetical protein